MEIYLKPIISACYVFPVLAVLFTLPYVLYEYRKYGSILVLRTGIVYTFIFYMLTSYFMTILPLPPLDSVTEGSAELLLVPFDAVRRVFVNADVVVSSPVTYINVLKCGDFWQIIFNILLLVPFGVYLRYYFRRPWWQVLLFSLCYSLFFELTQLSGLYGIYRYPYRFFEVDDLICNTLGGMLGYLITPFIVFILPNRERLDEIAYERGKIVSEFRRTIAWLIDITVMLIPVVAALIYNKESIYNAGYDIRYVICAASYIAAIFTLSTRITEGCTLGKSLVKIKLHKNKDGRLGIVRLFMRYWLIYGISLPSPVYAYNMYHKALEVQGNEYFICVALCVIFISTALYFAIDLILCLFSDTRNMLYDRLTGITHISTISR